MTAWIDKKYINLISGSIEGFTWKSATIAECRCPICGDSKKSKRKRRGTFIDSSTHFTYYCHNCGYNESLYVLLRDHYPSRFDEYRFEKQKAKAGWATEEKPEEKPQKEVVYETLDIFKGLSTIENLPDNHKAKLYIEQRKIPKKFWSKMYYCPHYKLWANKRISNTLFEKTKDVEDQRIVIPFFSRDNRIIGCQGRYIGPDKIKNADQRYFTQKIGKDNFLAYGIERLDVSKKVKVVEGPIDSMFLDNSMAAAGAALKRLFKLNLDAVYIFDNQPHSPEIVKLMQDVIDAGKDIFIWPQEIDWQEIKDINDAILVHIDIEPLIEKRTYRGIYAQLMFDQWKKVH